MFYLLKILLIVCFFALPVNMGPFAVSMWNFLWLGIRSPFPGFLYCALALVSIIYSLCIIKPASSPISFALSTLAIILIVIPVVVLITKANQFSTIAATTLYSIFFILFILNLIVGLRNRHAVN